MRLTCESRLAPLTYLPDVFVRINHKQRPRPNTTSETRRKMTRLTCSLTAGLVMLFNTVANGERKTVTLVPALTKQQAAFACYRTCSSEDLLVSVLEGQIYVISAQTDNPWETLYAYITCWRISALLPVKDIPRMTSPVNENISNWCGKTLQVDVTKHLKLRLPQISYVTTTWTSHNWYHIART